MFKMKVIFFTIFAICCNLAYSFEMLSEIFEDFPNKCSDNINRSPFVQIGQKYYFIEATKELNWFAAAQFCFNMDAELVTIESADEMRFLSQHLKPLYSKRNFWTSGTDLATEGKFEWFSTGKPMVFTKWEKDQPDNWQGNEHCVHLGYYDFTMNDLLCTRELHFICEAKTPKTIAVTIF